MSQSLAGTGALARLALRRDRIMLPAWIYLVLIGVSETAYVFTRLYKTPSARAGLAASGEGNPALLFLYGRLNGTSVGALTAWRYGVWAALFAALCALGVWAAFIRNGRRDLGAGLLAARRGRPSASAALRGPLSLAWRLQWTSLAGWAAGYVVIFAVCGAAAKGIGQLFGTSSALRNEFARIGGQPAIVNAYLAALMLLAGLGGSAYGVSSVSRLLAEENAGRADPVMSGAGGRVRWGLSHLLVAAAGTACLLAAAGVATGLGYGLRTGGAGPEAARMLGAAMAQLPAALVIAGLAVAAFGLVPDACTAVGWTALGLVVAVSIFGPTLRLSQWVLNLSPFTHAPRLPGGAVAATPLAWLSALAVALAAGGLAALRRRDIAGS